MQVIYRVRQFLRGLRATVSAEESAAVTQLLTPKACNLFQRMPVDGQRHSLNVLSTLRAAGHDDEDLAVAALLHDVGKVAADEAGVPLRLWLRGPLVLAEALLGERLTMLAADETAVGWRFALHVHVAHPQIGAVWAQAAGCSELTCWLIAHHQHKGPLAQNKRWLDLLSALQWADGKN